MSASGGHTVTRYHDISCGHRVHLHESKCRHLHGHNYRIHFTCRGDLDNIGRVLDFTVIKNLLCNWLEDHWDHRFLVWEKDPIGSMLKNIDRSVVLVPFNPTAENMAEYLVTTIGPPLLRGTGVLLTTVAIEETAKCSATFTLNSEILRG